MEIGHAFALLRLLVPRLLACALIAGALFAPQQTAALLISIGEQRVRPLVENIGAALVPDEPASRPKHAP